MNHFLPHSGVFFKFVVVGDGCWFIGGWIDSIRFFDKDEEWTISRRIIFWLPYLKKRKSRVRNSFINNKDIQ